MISHVIKPVRTLNLGEKIRIAGQTEKEELNRNSTTVLGLCGKVLVPWGCRGGLCEKNP